MDSSTQKRKLLTLMLFQTWLSQYGQKQHACF